MPSPEPLATAAVPPSPATPTAPGLAIPPVSSTRALLGASFDLLGRSSEEMRRASFYIGAVVLGTAGPLALASWAIEVIGFDRTTEQMRRALDDGAGGLFALLALLAAIGLTVAIVESRSMAMALLGGRMAGRPVTPRQALARSRSVFWRAIVAAIIVAIPIGIVQTAAEGVITAIVGRPVDVSIVIATLATAIVGAPLAYVLAGVVLGDVDPFEAVRRSVRVFRARKMAAAVVAAFETTAVLLILAGLSAGLDVALRVFSALGLGPDAGPVGLALTTVGIVATIFAAGTLLFTVYAITVAPQVVMFVGLTHATIGLDRVRPGGSHDPDARRPGTSRFRRFTRPMLLGFGLGLLGLASLVTRLQA
jgi:hypothetical protein